MPDEDNKTTKPKIAKVPEAKKSTMGLTVNTASALCYGTGFMPYVGWITGLVFLVFEKDKGIRFHALQSLTLFGSISVLQFLFGNTFLFRDLFSLIYLVQFILWLMLIYKTYHEDHWILPYIGKWAAKQIK